PVDPHVGEHAARERDAVAAGRGEPSTDAVDEQRLRAALHPRSRVLPRTVGEDRERLASSQTPLPVVAEPAALPPHREPTVGTRAASPQAASPSTLPSSRPGTKPSRFVTRL